MNNRKYRNAPHYAAHLVASIREDLRVRYLAFDPFASARAFDGWARDQRRSQLEFVPVVMPTTWHLTHGWRQSAAGLRPAAL